jgi:hypothetical protein
VSTTCFSLLTRQLIPSFSAREIFMASYLDQMPKQTKDAKRRQKADAATAESDDAFDDMLAEVYAADLATAAAGSTTTTTASSSSSSSSNNNSTPT